MTNNSDSWMQRRWRPLMAMQYMVVCIADFIIFPVLFTLVQFWGNQGISIQFTQWVPITLQSGGFYHIAMGAVLGITAWSRGQEKLATFTKSSESYAQNTDLGSSKSEVPLR